MRGPLRVALVHDWLDSWGGAENVLVELLRLFPDADLHTLIDVMPAASRYRLGAKRARTSWLQHLPGARAWFRYCLPLMPAAIERFDFTPYDLVLSSSHAVAKGARTAPGQVHVCYCHTPARYAWEQRERYVPARGLRAAIMHRLLDRLRNWDRDSAVRVNYFIANSEHIARRITHCYGRGATVIYPPVDCARFASGAAVRDGAREEYYLAVSRLVPYKRVDLLLDAFRAMPQRRLVVVGEGPQAAALARDAPANVEFRGRVDTVELVPLVQRARAFVHAAEEDFGIALVEAQAAGTPVIAFSGGGAAEIVRGLDTPAPTGVLFEAQSSAAIVAAIERFEAFRTRIQAQACQSNAARFAPQHFRQAMRAFVERVTTAPSSPVAGAAAKRIQ
jgi:glycosyltransferase involved in cell wall biosynthesis